MIPPGPVRSLSHGLHWLAIEGLAATAVGAVIAGAMFIWNIKLDDPGPDRSSRGRAVVGLAVAGAASALIGAIT